MEGEDENLELMDKSKLSKGQLKKLKEKQKKEADEKLKAEQAAKGETVIEDDKKKDDKKKKGGKAGAGSAIAKLAAQNLALIKQQEEEIRLEQERLQRIEDERVAEVERQIQLQKDEIERRKKEKEERIKQMKKDGTYLSKKDIANAAKNEKIRQQFLQTTELGEKKIEEIKEQPKQQQKKKFVNKDRIDLTQIVREDDKNQETNQNQQAEFDWEAEAEQLVLQDEQQPTKQDDVVEKPKDLQSEKEILKQKSKEQMSKLKLFKKKDQKKQQEEQEDKPENASENMRSPIVCILGHVDTGKTSLLDKIRNTNVQEGEAGGITQQIGATFFPKDKMMSEIEKLKGTYDVEVNVPGLLIIDTPGHESFSNLRTRGSGLCDMAILVIDIMHGLEKQTIESIELLRMRKTPFLIALNKIDRIFEWKSVKYSSSYKQLMEQGKSQQNEFETRAQNIQTELAQLGFNTEMYWKNPDIRKYVSIVPTSGITGEGIPDIFAVLLKYTQNFLKDKITEKNLFQCTVLEIKKIEGLGTTIDVILVNGTLYEGDKVILLGFQGPIVTNIRALLTPHPMKEMRVKGEYLHYKEIQAAQGIKICANDLEDAVAGSQLYVVRNELDIEKYSTELMKDLSDVRKKVKLHKKGVCVAASTLGSLEALLNFLQASKIPVSYICIGNVSKDDVTKALKSILADDEMERKQEYACVLAFDVKVIPEAQEYADKNNIKIFTAQIIYHLFDKFTAYVKQIQEERKINEGKRATWPAIIKPVQFFRNKDPIIMGVDVEQGVLRCGTPLTIFDKSRNTIKIGVVDSIESNHKAVKQARKETGSVAIKLKGDTSISCEKHFTLEDKFVSILSRDSIDLLKEYFREEMTKPDWNLVRELKPFFNII